MTDMWTTIAAERRALADDLTGIPADAWSARSLCDEWTVQDVLGHMTSTAAMTPPKFLSGFVAAGFNFSKFGANGIAQHRGGSPEEALENFRAQQDSTSSPPGPKLSWLGEAIVHAEAFVARWGSTTPTRPRPCSPSSTSTRAPTPSSGRSAASTA